MSQYKIVHLISNLDHGGAERFVIDLCNEMAKKNKDVTLISLCANALEDSFVDELDPSVNYVSFSKKAGLSIRVIFELTAWLCKENPNVVHSHLNSSEYLVLFRLINNSALFYHTIHSIAEAECPELYIKYLRRIFYRVNKVRPVTISAYCSASYRRYYRLENDQLIENARPELRATILKVDLLKKYSRDPAEVLLVHIGRISIEKNQRMLIETVRQLNRTESRKCRLLIIGQVKDPLLYTELQLVAQQDPLIEFLGIQKNIADYLSIADAFCLSSNHEGMPISLIEAMSIGCIPVCTAVGGICDMITNGVNGFLSPANDADAYADSLKNILYRTDLHHIRKETLRSYHDRYTIALSAENYLKMYTEAV